jgi:hypothetical protein
MKQNSAAKDGRAICRLTVHFAPKEKLVMKKLVGMLAAIPLLVLAGVPASAATFNLSGCCGTGPFGTATGVDLGAQTGSTDTVEITVQMSPNFILDTGSHFAATFSLVGTGRVDGANLDALNGGNPPNFFDTNPHLTVAGYSNSPFGDFKDAITGNCGSGSSSGGCGSKLVFDITNFQGFAAATNQFDQPPAGGPLVSVFMAVDIIDNQTGANYGNTGAVGLSLAPEINPLGSPTPIPGAVWLFASGIGGIGALMRRRKKNAKLA